MYSCNVRMYRLPSVVGASFISPPRLLCTLVIYLCIDCRRSYHRCMLHVHMPTRVDIDFFEKRRGKINGPSTPPTFEYIHSYTTATKTCIYVIGIRVVAPCGHLARCSRKGDKPGWVNGGCVLTSFGRVGTVGMERGYSWSFVPFQPVFRCLSIPTTKRKSWNSCELGAIGNILDCQYKTLQYNCGAQAAGRMPRAHACTTPTTPFPILET